MSRSVWGGLLATLQGGAWKFSRRGTKGVAHRPARYCLSSRTLHRLTRLAGTAQVSVGKWVNNENVAGGTKLVEVMLSVWDG
jgi:hypothetical protein